MAEMAQFVYDFYQSKLQHWNKIKNKEKEELSKQRHKERLQQLDEEEKVKDLVEALQVFQCVTNSISGVKFCTMSLVMPSIVLIKKQVNLFELKTYILP